MRPTTPEHLATLTGLRGVASLWVALFHGWQTFGSPSLTLLGVPYSGLLAAGYIGVDLFFVLSGFLLGVPLMQALQRGAPSRALGRFWQRRCRRVLPAYTFQVVLLLAILGWQQALPERWVLSLLSHLTLTTNFFPYSVAPLNGVYWSLPVEWDFYLVLPLLLWSVLRVGWRYALPLAMAIALGYRWLCYSTVWVVPPDSLLSWWAGSIHQLPARLDEFALGIFAAHWRLRKAPGTGVSDALLIGAMLTLLLAAAFLGARGDVFSRVDVPLVFVQFSVLGALFACLCFGAAGNGRVARALLSGRVLVGLGTISYSLYLWHLPILTWQAQWPWLQALGRPWVNVLSAFCVLAVSTLSYRCLERPFLPQAAPAR